MNRLEAALDQLADIPAQRAWLWPLMMVIVGFGAVLAALLFYPGGDEWVYLAGVRFGGECGFQQATSQPCPSCGMTRSWVHLVRGDVLTAMRYNLAGVIMLCFLFGLGLLGLVRLATRDATRFRVSLRWLSAGVMAWMIGPYLGLWFLRMAGFNALP